MNKHSLRICFVSFAVACSAASQAYDLINVQGHLPVDKQNVVQAGVISASLVGSISSTNSNTTSSIGIAGSYFVTNQIELIARINFDSFNSDRDTYLNGGARYYLITGQDKKALPFVGVNAGLNIETGSSNTFNYGGEIGVQLFVAPNVAFTPVLRGTNSTRSGSSTWTTSLEFGLTYFFRY